MRLATGGSAVPASPTDLRPGQRSLAAHIKGWRNKSKPTFRGSSPAIRKARRTTGYGFASPACSTALHAAGICASVIGGFGFGGSRGGVGGGTPAAEPKARDGGA